MYRRFSDRFPHTAPADLNVTPLLDLCFVLLLIFMISTPLLAARKVMSVDLPRTDAGAAATANAHQLCLTISPDGSYLLDGTEVTHDALTKALDKACEKSRDTSVVIAADKSLTVQRLTDAFALVRSAGVEKIGIVTESKSPK